MLREPWSEDVQELARSYATIRASVDKEARPKMDLLLFTLAAVLCREIDDLSRAWVACQPHRNGD